MFACKQVAKALERGDYNNLPFFSRMGLKLHVSLCVVCGKYHKQVMIIQDGVRRFLAGEEELSKESPGLPESTKEQMRSVVHGAAHTDEPT